MIMLLNLLLAPTPTPALAPRLEVAQQKIPLKKTDADVSFEMVHTPGGTVTVDGKPVTVKPIWVGKTELAWEAFDPWEYRWDLTPEERTHDADAKSRPSKPYLPPDRGFGHKGWPAISITLHAAQTYCAWLTKQTGKPYRLPTRAEWIYLAQAGSDKTPSLSEVAWYADNANEKTHPCAKKKPNAWGIYDALGNASEWVQPEEGQTMYQMGGCFLSDADQVNFTGRMEYVIDWQQDDPQIPKSVWWLSNGPFAGFRVVCDEAPSKG